MSHVVGKPFNTVNRRFAVGAQVNERDDLSPRRTGSSPRKPHRRASRVRPVFARALWLTRATQRSRRLGLPIQLPCRASLALLPEVEKKP
jgi:hypothetical protein